MDPRLEPCGSRKAHVLHRLHLRPWWTRWRTRSSTWRRGRRAGVTHRCRRRRSQVWVQRWFWQPQPSRDMPWRRREGAEKGAAAGAGKRAEGDADASRAVPGAARRTAALAQNSLPPPLKRKSQRQPGSVLRMLEQQAFDFLAHGMG